MGVVIEDIRYKPTDFTTNTVTTDYLLGNIGDKITIEIDFRAEEIFVTGAEVGVDRIITNVSPYLVNTPNQLDIIFVEAIGVFDNYRVGDVIGSYDSVADAHYTYYVSEIIDENNLKNGSAIRCTDAGGTPIDFSNNGQTQPNRVAPQNSYLYLKTPLTAVNYRWNFIGNDELETFSDKIANQLNQAKAGGLTTGGGTVPMIFDTPVTNNYGSATVEKLTGTLETQRFTITHETIITPLFLAGQYFDLLDGIAPDYLNAGECLKGIFSIDAGRNSNDPNYIQTVGFSANEGNTGWYDENFNGNANKFSIESVTYKNQALETIGSLELTENIQYVEIVVKDNRPSGVFVSGQTQFDLTFFILPDDTDEYRNNDKTIIENFYLDKAFNTVGTAFTGGDNLGTDYQVISSVGGVFIDANTFQINAAISLTAAGVADLAEKGFEYFIGVSTQDHTKETEETDRVHLKADIQPFFVNLTDDGMIVFDEVKVLRHYESDFELEGSTTPVVRTEDDVLTYCKFHIDRTDRQDDDISISSITSQVVAKKTDGSEFVLETFSQSLSGALVVNGTQFINVSSERIFKMPAGEQRKTISTKRRIDLDTVDSRYYEVKYPFLMRWEYWEGKSGVDTDAFDTNEPNNGLNENWQRYDTLNDWNIYFRTRITATKNGNLQSYQNDLLLTTYDYLEDEEWINETIETFDADTGDPLNGLIKNPCKVVVSKEYSGANVPVSADDVEWVMRIEIFEQGGVSDIRFLSSVYDWTENSWFKSVDGSNKVKKDKIGNVFTAEALIDFGKLPSLQDFKISARIYDEEGIASIEGCYLATEDNQPITTQNNSNLVPESCDEEPPIVSTGKETENGELKETENGQIKIPD